MIRDVKDIIKQKLKELEQNLIYLRQVSYDIVTTRTEVLVKLKVNYIKKGVDLIVIK